MTQNIGNVTILRWTADLSDPLATKPVHKNCLGVKPIMTRPVTLV
jgi:hypothetical protein